MHSKKTAKRGIAKNVAGSHPRRAHRSCLIDVNGRKPAPRTDAAKLTDSANEGTSWAD